MEASSPSKRYSFEEFSLYYQSTEKVTDRRHAINKWNYSLCAAIMTAIAAITSWTLERAEFRLVMIMSVLVLAGMGMLLCVLWVGQIRDMKDLNNAKFDVLNAMAPHVQFEHDTSLTSAEPFAREWKLLEAMKAARPVATMEIIAMRSSDTEIFLATAFRWLFLLIVTAGAATVIANWNELISNLFNLGPA